MFAIADLPLLGGRIGLCPVPGRSGDYRADMAVLLDWRPSLVLTLVNEIELEGSGADRLPRDLRAAGVAWRHIPVTDFRAPCSFTEARWPDVSDEAQGFLRQGGRVLAHCYGGCGRSGMALMRLMVDVGETPESALARLRKARPCAVETPSQMAWAGGGYGLAAAAG